MPDFADDTSTELERKAAALRWVCVVETVSYAILFAFMVAGSRVGVRLFGSVHGTIFLLFAAMVLGIRSQMGWTWTYAAIVLVTGPIGAVIVYRRLSHSVP